MISVPHTFRSGWLVAAGAAGLFVAALAAPKLTLLAMPLAILVLAALALYSAPRVMVVLFAVIYGLAIEFRLDELAESGEGIGTLGSAAIKVFPFALAAALLLRYGPAKAINWPFLAFTAIAAVSVVVLPMGRVATYGEMVRSFIGSTAPFVLAFAAAPRSVWDTLCKSLIFVPIISAVLALAAHVAGIYSAFDVLHWRFQGLHSAPFLAGFCTTAIFAATLEYLRGFRPVWLVLGGLNLMILLATQARAPLIAVALFLGIVFLAARGRTFPLQHKVNLVMGGVIPGLVLLAPLFAIALERFLAGNVYTGTTLNFSGRDIIWPYFLEAIETRPLFGYGLGAGKLIVDPEDPQIKLLRSNAAHNEYLRLSVDAGIVGCAAIFLAIIAWIWTGTRRVGSSSQIVLRASLIAYLFHSAFDNTLIASTAVVQFAWFAAALARAQLEAEATPWRWRRPSTSRNSHTKRTAEWPALQARSPGW